MFPSHSSVGNIDMHQHGTETVLSAFGYTGIIVWANEYNRLRIREQIFGRTHMIITCHKTPRKDGNLHNFGRIAHVIGLKERNVGHSFVLKEILA